MPRKGENIRKRKDGRWEARYIKARDINGKIRYGYLYGRTYREVKAKKNYILSEVQFDVPQNRNNCRLASNATFRTASQWWKLQIRHTVKGSTFSNYEAILKNQLLPEISSIPVRNISNKTISYLTQKKKEQGLANGTIHVTLSVLKNILNFAQSEGLHTAEPIKYPHLTVNSAFTKIMDTDNYRMLEEYLLQHLDRFNYGILLCMNTGIRVGELSGLRWEDFNFPEKKLHICRTVIRIKNLGQIPDPETHKIAKTVLCIGAPKTANSLREIPIPDRLLDLGKKLADEKNTYILTGTLKCMEPRIIQRKYSALLKQCQIPPLKIHSLRHQFSCRWVEQGFDTKSLSEILGHTSVRTTLDLYVHIRSDTKRKYMNELMEI